MQTTYIIQDLYYIQSLSNIFENHIFTRDSNNKYVEFLVNNFKIHFSSIKVWENRKHAVSINHLSARMQLLIQIEPKVSLRVSEV